MATLRTEHNENAITVNGADGTLRVFGRTVVSDVSISDAIRGLPSISHPCFFFAARSPLRERNSALQGLEKQLHFLSMASVTHFA